MQCQKNFSIPNAPFNGETSATKCLAMFEACEEIFGVVTFGTRRRNFQCANRVAIA
jgi:hypothetical protein